MNKKILFVTNDFLDARISRAPLIRFIHERNEHIDIRLYTCLSEPSIKQDDLFFLGRRNDYFGNFKKLIKLKKDVEFDLIISRGIEYSIICGIIWFSTNNVILLSGLGRVFGLKNSKWSAILKRAYVLLLQLLNPTDVIVQNPDDQKALQKISPKLVLGSGIVEYKISKPLIRNRDKIVFVIASRLTQSKGIMQLLDGFLLANEKVPNICLKIYGNLYLDHESLEWFNSIVERHVNIEYLGHIDLIENEIQQSDFVIYPTLYREGVPRFLIQALYFEKPIITTNMPGSRECFDNNGILLESTLLTKTSIKAAILEVLSLDYSVLASNSKNLYNSKFSRLNIYKEYEAIFMQSLR